MRAISYKKPCLRSLSIGPYTVVRNHGCTCACRGVILTVMEKHPELTGAEANLFSSQRIKIPPWCHWQAARLTLEVSGRLTPPCEYP